MKERQCTLKPVQKGGGKHKDWLRPSEKQARAERFWVFCLFETAKVNAKNAFTGK
jgi:hypothetical protein